MRTCLIVGPFRSGTSLVASMVHRLGWMVAPTIPVPAPPSWRSDWEDPALSIPLIERRPLDLEAYMENRRALASALGFQGVALKSPYLALRWPAVLAASGPNPVVIRTYRDGLTRFESLRAHPAIDHGDDSRICSALRAVVPTIEVGYEWGVEDQKRLAAALAHALGVVDDAAVSAAAALVGRPTRYSDGVPDGRAEGGREG